MLSPDFHVCSELHFFLQIPKFCVQVNSSRHSEQAPKGQTVQFLLTISQFMHLLLDVR
jgi:hypothetical protein